MRWGRTQAVQHGLFAIVPAIFTIALLIGCAHSGILAFDFRHTYWPGIRHILSGTSPYVYPHSATTGPFTYPAFAGILFAPAGLLSISVGNGLFVALNFAALIGALRMLQVRDWRVYGLVLLWPPVFVAWETANVSLPLVFGLAVVWRYRDRAVIAGTAAALLISIKPIMWPVALWLLASRRHRSLAYMVGFGAVINVLAWSIIGFGQIHDFARIVQQEIQAGGHNAYTPAGLFLHLGAPFRLAEFIGLIPGLLLCAIGVIAGSRSERAALILCTAAILACTPVAWLHYYSLLVVPLALARPRFDWVWLLPLLMWPCPAVNVLSWQIALALAVGGLVVVTCLVRPTGSPDRRRIPSGLQNVEFA
jgi:hypothetical protein